ncbi:MAG: dehydrogenase E1 component subunit alpha/beta [Armatimonadota bacterium]
MKSLELVSDNKIDIANIGPSVARMLMFDIFLINDFEHALLKLQEDGCVWGPAHTSVGQEAVAAGAIAALRKSDKVAGSHRAHHQFLAKVMNYVLPEDWNPCECDLPGEAYEVVRKSMAEIMGLKEGYCGGRGGSMHLRHVPAGVAGTNGIVGGGIPISTGVALAEKLQHTGNIVVCFFGDGAANQGTFHESANMAAIYNLPIIYFIENNMYAVGTAATDACAIPNLADRASAYGMDGFVVDGMDPVAVYNATIQAVERIRRGGSPCIIEAKCYRRYHHAGIRPGSALGYRGKDEEAEWLAREAVFTFPTKLVDAGVMDESEIECLRNKAHELVSAAVDYCTEPGTPREIRAQLWPKPETVSEGLRSDGHEWECVKFSEREDFSEFDVMRYSDAIASVTGRWFEKDDSVFVLGEEVANFGGGAYGATKGLPTKYPDRVINTPISEAGFVGMGCGAALAGMKPIVEIMFGDFALVAADQLFSQIAKTRHMYGGKTDVPLVARTRAAAGCGYGGQHSMDPVALYALFPGWRIVYPSDAFDYIGLFNTAMRSLDPVLIIEHHSLYNQKTPVPKGNLDYFVEFDKARIVGEGDQVTLIAYGAMLGQCVAVREELLRQGVSAEVIDLRTLDLPGIDYDTIGRSIKKTGMAVVVEEAPKSQSIGATIASEIMTRFFDHLDGPVIRVTSEDIPNPVSKVLEEAAIISVDEILSVASAAARRRY